MDGNNLLKQYKKQNQQKKQKNAATTNIEEEISSQNLYKTELCRSYEDSRSCKYGSKCQFAHGKEELRPVLRHPKYKTEVCKSFYNTGTCRYGRRCRFIHSAGPGKTNPSKNQQQSSSLALQKKTSGNDPYVNVRSEWNATGASQPQSNSDDSWIEAMGSLTLSPSSELVQLVIPTQRIPVRNEQQNKGGRLSFFESIAGAH